MDFRKKIVKTIKPQLISYVESGKKTTPLKQKVADKFGISYEDAYVLVNTEIARIQTERALTRYKNYGIKEFEFFADTDNETCDKCAALDGKKFKISKAKIGVNAPPMHDGCRCCILPIID